MMCVRARWTFRRTIQSLQKVKRREMVWCNLLGCQQAALEAYEGTTRQKDGKSHGS
jgi:hypothetical protein